MSKKETNSGVYYKLIKVVGGNYVIETITLEGNKVIDCIREEECYPAIALAKMGKTAFLTAGIVYDKERSTK